jgi:hypothetical protein
MKAMERSGRGAGQERRRRLMGVGRAVSAFLSEPPQGLQAQGQRLRACLRPCVQAARIPYRFKQLSRFLASSGPGHRVRTRSGRGAPC